VVLGFALGLIPLVSWEFWSVFYYGDLVPNTACAKVNHVLPLSVRLGHAVDYFRLSLILDYLTIPAILVATLGGLWRGGAQRHLSAGVLLYFLYLGWIPGDFMAGRMQSTPFLVAVALVPTLPPLRKSWALALAAVVVALSLANPRSPIRPDRLVSVDDIGDLADERAHYCCGRSQKDLRPEPWNGLPPEVLVGWGGGITYETGPSTHFVDRLALSDPLLSRLPIVTKLGGRFRPGHLSRVLPDGYLESLQTGENRIQDPAIAALWDDVRVATRDPLTDLRRLRAIGGTILCGRAHRDAVMPR
jgi:arabinofuranosyltransferase